MTTSSSHSVQSFEFRSDFSRSSETETVQLPVEALKQLIEEAKAAGAAHARAEGALQSRQLFQNCLRDLAHLAELLQNAGLDQRNKARSEGIIGRTCQALIDGQKDLFDT